MGEGGALVISDELYFETADIIWQKGTNRGAFIEGKVDKYTWVDRGSSYLPSELCAAYLYPALLCRDEINKNRLRSWEQYYEGLSGLKRNGILELPVVPPECEHNAHMFYIKTSDIGERTSLMHHLGEKGVSAVFHYVPLHSSPAGLRYGQFAGDDIYTTKESERLLRLPMYYDMKPADIEYIVGAVCAFYQ
jgi:dTDP-4-amino-4,6-dideoxygalactose transaminase